jgi:hypothetical protein
MHFLNDTLCVTKGWMCACVLSIADTKQLTKCCSCAWVGILQRWLIISQVVAPPTVDAQSESSRHSTVLNALSFQVMRTTVELILLWFLVKIGWWSEQNVCISKSPVVFSYEIGIFSIQSWITQQANLITKTSNDRINELSTHFYSCDIFRIHLQCNDLELLETLHKYQHCWI